MKRPRHLLYSFTFFLFFCVIVALSGCTGKTTVVLLPGPDGKVGKVTVTSDGGFAEIDEAREATTVRGHSGAPTATRILSETAIDKDFHDTLASLPEQPRHFLLYFQMDSQKLTADGAGTISEILAAIEEKQSVDISVVGHTDTSGDRDYNYRLSTKRAESIAKILEKHGVKPGNIKTTSHGENNPLIPTEDNVNEPRNRRVEVTVR